MSLQTFIFSAITIIITVALLSSLSLQVKDLNTPSFTAFVVVGWISFLLLVFGLVRMTFMLQPNRPTKVDYIFICIAFLFCLLQVFISEVFAKKLPKKTRTVMQLLFSFNVVFCVCFVILTFYKKFVETNDDLTNPSVAKI